MQPVISSKFTSVEGEIQIFGNPRVLPCDVWKSQQNLPVLEVDLW